MNQNNILEPLVRFLLLSIIFAGLKLERKCPKSEFLGFLGMNTYPIYLWHVIGRTLSLNQEYYYIVSVGWVVILFVVVKITETNEPIRKILGR